MSITTAPNPSETPIARYQRLATSRASLLDTAERMAHVAQAHAGEVWHLHEPEHEPEHEAAMALSAKTTALYNEIAAYTAAVTFRPARNP
jgi:hypothetical protein